MHAHTCRGTHKNGLAGCNHLVVIGELSTRSIRPQGMVQPTRPFKPVNQPQVSQQQPEKPVPPKPMTEAEKEELQKKIKRAQRFAQPAPIVAGITKKKIVLGKRLSTDNSEASQPKTMKPAQMEMSVKSTVREAETKTSEKGDDSTKKTDLELDVCLSKLIF